MAHTNFWTDMSCPCSESSYLKAGLLQWPHDWPSASGSPQSLSMYTLPSGFLLKYHLLGVQKCFGDYTYYVEVKTSSRPLSIWFQLNVSANFPDSPTGQTGIIIVLGIYFAPFQPLGWGHFISSLVLPITPSWSFRDSGLPHILTKAPVQNHPPLNFQRIHDRAQILLLIMCWFFFSFFMVVAVFVYIAKYATLTPEIIYSRGASTGDP